MKLQDLKTKKFVSIIMPCLNEEDSVGVCVKTAIAALKKEKLAGEVIVADNGSSDNSSKVATKAGAKVIEVKKRGYGEAYLGGIKAAIGDYLILGDSDASYNFGQIPKFIKKLDRGADFVIGSRLKGKIEAGAMPVLHRFLGVPLLTFLVNLFFGTKISDAHCGLRAIRKEALKKLNLASTGMEFASEMIISAAHNKLKISEIPISYHKRHGYSKLNPLTDTLRHLNLIFASFFRKN